MKKRRITILETIFGISILGGITLLKTDKLNLFENNVEQTHYGTGDNIAGNKIVQQKLFSDTQFVKLWPSSLGGVDRLNIDNIGTLKASAPYNENSITMYLNVTPLELPPLKVEGRFETQDAQIYRHTDSQKYVFDTQQNKSHKIVLENRIFIVTLNKIKRVELEKVSYAIEYEFGISETN
ncbi:MAG: hypothetical protein K9M15_02115 [Candidatus Marinimicrobia bacterium]|nr:hypothetical protein [Candidatus Neomarinimicrobiota bacterium]